MQLPKEFDFKSTINTEVDRYHAKEIMPQGYYHVTTDYTEYSWDFTKEEMETKITNNIYIIIGDEYQMTNYICINGKKAELTEEQMKALGIELPKVNPFERVSNKANDFYSYWFITSMGTVNEAFDHGFEAGNGNDELRYRAGNYCTSWEIINQRALHETLNRLLWRYSMEHDGDKINWNNVSDKHAIYYESDTNKYKVACWQTVYYSGNIYFHTKETAEAAIKEIIEPFMKAHPEFKW